MHADPGSANRHDADLLVGTVPEGFPDRRAVRKRGRVEARHVAGEIEVLLGPFANDGQIGAEALRHDVIGISDEDGSIAYAWIAVDVLDHLRVVIRRQCRLFVTTIRHGKPANEVRQPRIRRSLLLGILMEVVIDLPGLVADPQVVRFLADQVVEHHEVRHHDLVHAPPGLEAMKVVLGGLSLEMTGLVGEVLAHRMDPLAPRGQHRGDRVLRQPIDFEIRMEPAELVGNRDVSLGVSQPDRRGDIEGTLFP